MNHTGTLPIRTERLLLRPFCSEDLRDMRDNWIGDPAVQHEYGEPCYETDEQAAVLLQSWVAAYADPAFYRWAVVRLPSAGSMMTVRLRRSNTASGRHSGDTAMRARRLPH